MKARMDYGNRRLQLRIFRAVSLAPIWLSGVALCLSLSGGPARPADLPCPIQQERETPGEFVKRLTYPIKIELIIEKRIYIGSAYAMVERTWRDWDQLPKGPVSAGSIRIRHDLAIERDLTDDPPGKLARLYLSFIEQDGIAWPRWSHFRWQPLPEGAAVRGHPLWPLAVFFYFQDSGFEARIGCWDWRDLMTLFGFLEVPEEDLIPNWINIELESQKKKRGGK